jgi:hypothetical protein
MPWTTTLMKAGDLPSFCGCGFGWSVPCSPVGPVAADGSVVWVVVVVVLGTVVVVVVS